MPLVAVIRDCSLYALEWGERIPDPRGYFGNSGMSCSRKQAPDVLPAGMWHPVPVNVRGHWTAAGPKRVKGTGK